MDGGHNVTEYTDNKSKIGIVSDVFEKCLIVD